MSVRRAVTALPGMFLLGPGIVSLLALAALLPVIDADPARGVTFSNSPFSDEVWNVLNARNLILLGTWSTDQWNLHFINGPFSLIEAAVFATLGVGMAQARLVAVVCTALAGAVVVLGLQRWVGRGPAFIAGVACVTSALALYYGRLAYVEPMTGLFLVAGLVTLPAVDRRAGAWGVAAGGAFALAIATKAVAIPCVALILLAIAWPARADPLLRRWLAGASVALVAAGALWAVVAWLPHRAEIALLADHVLPQIHFDLGPGAVRRVAAYLLGSGDDGAIARTLPLLIGAVVGVAVAARARARTPHRVLVLYGVAALAFGGSLAVVADASYHPNRYVVPFIPVAAILVGPAVAAIRDALAPAMRRLGPASATSALAAMACALALALPGLVQHVGWTVNASRSLPALQESGGQAVRHGDVVAGDYGALAAFRAPVTAIVTCCGTDPVNGGDLYATSGARVLVSSAKPPDWVSVHPAAWDARVRLFCFEWGARPEEFCAYRLP